MVHKGNGCVSVIFPTLKSVSTSFALHMYQQGSGASEKNSLRFKEVEEAMQGPAQSFLKEKEKEWLTPDLLDQVRHPQISLGT